MFYFSGWCWDLTSGHMLSIYSTTELYPQPIPLLYIRAACDIDLLTEGACVGNAALFMFNLLGNACSPFE